MKKIPYFTLFAFLFLSCNTEIKKEFNISSEQAVIGTWNYDNVESTPILAGNSKNEQIWLDYIDAHNNRDLVKISAMNTEDWEAHVFDGRIIKGNKAHQEFLSGWFKTSFPKWKTKWIVATKALDEEGEMTQWLISAEDQKYIDNEKNVKVIHLIHHVQIFDGKIKKLYAYSREAEPFSLKRVVKRN